MIENTAALWVWTVQVKVGAGWYPAASSDQPGSCRDIPMVQWDEGVWKILWLFVHVCPIPFVHICYLFLSRLKVSWDSYMIVMNLRCIALMSETSGITAALLPQAELWRVLEKAQIKRFVARKFREVEDSPLQTRRLKNFQEFPRIVNNCKESTYLDILRHLWCQSCSFSKILLAFGTRVILQDWFNNHQGEIA